MSRASRTPCTFGQVMRPHRHPVATAAAADSTIRRLRPSHATVRVNGPRNIRRSSSVAVLLSLRGDTLDIAVQKAHLAMNVFPDGTVHEDDGDVNAGTRTSSSPSPGARGR